MTSRRHLLLASPALLLVACTQAPVEGGAGKAAQHGVTFVYIGADDCPPCQAWRKTEMPTFEASALRARIEFRTILTAHWNYVADPYYWPADLAWIKDEVELRRGAPQYLVVKDGKVVLKTFGTGSWKTQVLPLLERVARA